MPNIDPRTMKSLMAKMGIKSSEIDALKVVIETADRTIVIEQPQVTQIEAQGGVSFQISGTVKEEVKSVQLEVGEDDINLVSEKTGIADKAKIKEAIEKANGDIAAAIIALTSN